MLKKIKEILKSYNLMLSNNAVADKLAIDRLLICGECPSNKVNSLGMNYCGECGCLIKAKVYSENNTCPLNKWER